MCCVCICCVCVCLCCVCLCVCMCCVCFVCGVCVCVCVCVVYVFVVCVYVVCVYFVLCVCIVCVFFCIHVARKKLQVFLFPSKRISSRYCTATSKHQNDTRMTLEKAASAVTRPPCLFRGRGKILLKYLKSWKAGDAEVAGSSAACSAEVGLQIHSSN